MSDVPPDAVASDPRTLGWMVGSPPPADKVISMAEPGGSRFPQLRWTFSNMRQMAPTVGVSRGLGAPSVFARDIDPAIDAVRFTPIDRKSVV